MKVTTDVDGAVSHFLADHRYGPDAFFGTWNAQFLITKTKITRRKRPSTLGRLDKVKLKKRRDFLIGYFEENW